MVEVELRMSRDAPDVDVEFDVDLSISEDDQQQIPLLP